MKITLLLKRTWRAQRISPVQCNNYLKHTASSVSTPTEDTSFADFVMEHLDQQAYLEAYPDVRSAGVDPVKHWIEFGMVEGRSFFPDATICHGDYARKVEGARWQHFVWRGQPVAFRINTPEDVPPEDALFAEFVRSHMDQQTYLEAYPDVRSAGVDPVKHWLEFGMTEGRFLHPDVKVFLGDIAEQFDSKHWEHFAWRGRPVAVQAVTPIKPSLISQINAQARHDPAVLAAGDLAIGRLGRLDGPDLLGRGGVDIRSIFTAIPERPDVVVVMPLLRAGGTEKFAADLVGALMALSHNNILVIVTDHAAESAIGWESLTILAPLRTARVIFWRDVCGPSYRSAQIFARLFNALRPSKVLVINSRVGLDMVAGFGRAVSRFAQIYCVYSNIRIDELSVPASLRFPYRTLPFSFAITDSTELADTLRRQWGELTGPGISVLPLRLQPAEDQIFSARRMARQARSENVTRSLHWVLVSHVESYSQIVTLSELARMRPADRFDLLGPLKGDLKEMFSPLPNITYQELLTDLSSVDFTEYDAVLFTSFCEDAASIALEMSEHAIPMVLPDTGGARETFNDTSVHFVRHHQDTHSTAQGFARALNDVAELTTSATLAMVDTARVQALARHAPDVYLKNVANIFKMSVDHV